VNGRERERRVREKEKKEWDRECDKELKKLMVKDTKAGREGR
jgi:hypothetical protein